MYEITLKGTAYERGYQQGQAFGELMRELFGQCPTWLGDVPHQRVARIRDTMVDSLRTLCPEMIEELEGISEGAGMPFDDVCTLNFVSAIGALSGCTNVIALIRSSEGKQPILAKTSDIGSDYAYYSMQRVQPEDGYAYLAISWAGCLWAEVGVNSAGLAAGQGSAPTMPGQRGEGIPTLEYPRVILERCGDVAEAIQFCQRIPMAGKGLNISLADKQGDVAIVEKSGTKSAVRRPRISPLRDTDQVVPGSVVDGVYCANHFLDLGMQGMLPLTLPGIRNLRENSEKRLANVACFFEETSSPTVVDIVSLLTTDVGEGGLCQQTYPELTTHYVYLVRPSGREILLGRGVPCRDITFSTYRL